MCLCKYGCSSQLRTPEGRSDLTLDVALSTPSRSYFQKNTPLCSLETFAFKSRTTTFYPSQRDGEKSLGMRIRSIIIVFMNFLRKYS
jgi:hypothetical protein